MNVVYIENSVDGTALMGIDGAGPNIITVVNRYGVNCFLHETEFYLRP